MKEIKGTFPIFKALMAIVYLLLGVAILVLPAFRLPVNNSLRTTFGIILVLYGIIRVYTSFAAYRLILKEKCDEEL